MAFIEQIGDSELFERDRAALGYVPNYTRLFAHRPAVYEAWLGLRERRSTRSAPRPIPRTRGSTRSYATS